jgi:hypothetical protein
MKSFETIQELTQAINSYKEGKIEPSIEEIHIEIKEIVLNDKVRYKVLSD